MMIQTDDIHESFYDLFNQRFRRIDDPNGGARYYTNIAIGAHLKPSRVDPNFQCVVIIKESEVENTPAPFLNRFEKYCITHHTLLEEALSHLPPCIRIIVKAAMEKVYTYAASMKTIIFLITIILIPHFAVLGNNFLNFKCIYSQHTTPHSTQMHR